MYVPADLLQWFRNIEKARGPLSAAQTGEFLQTTWVDYKRERDRRGHLTSLEYEYIFSHMLQAARNGATLAEILKQCSSKPRGEPPFGPLNPVPSDEPLLDRILRDHPGLTRDEAIAEAEAFGFDLTSPLYQANRPKPQPE
jgi:hypothetical protein